MVLILDSSRTLGIGDMSHKFTIASEALIVPLMPKFLRAVGFDKVALAVGANGQGDCDDGEVTEQVGQSGVLIHAWSPGWVL
jgi:hypothetical protein